MKSAFFACIACLVSLALRPQQLSNLSNPVLPGVADAGAIKYNGEYYMGGVSTNGSFYTSSDLVNWKGPVHVFSMNNEWATPFGIGNEQIHADDISYINGVFHLLWSVNYWGKNKHVVHIGHAVSNNILGPYTEPIKAAPLENRIDPKLFIDDDRKCYLYMVKFTDGNTIWMRPMKDPYTFSGEPKYVFSSLPGTWETLDNRVEEGPWVMKYRNRYYLMYNTNHTATTYGNYALGVAEAGSPLDFNHGNKYPYPVVKSNQIDLEDRFVDLLRFSPKEPGLFRYTTEQPPDNWHTQIFDDTKWLQGKSGFGSPVLRNSTTRSVRTNWNGQNIWLRKSFQWNSAGNGNLMLRIHHDGDTKVFLNNEIIYDNKGAQYTTWNFDRKAAALLREGTNVLSVQGSMGRNNFLDVSLFDMKNEQGDDILFSPGQPSIVHGPNGFEWWMVYMANKNNDPRGQYINRVHFFNKRMFAEITAGKTKGYFPAPSMPTFGDLFNDSTAQWKSNWNIHNGSWSIYDKALIQNNKTPAYALIRSRPAANYLFEAGIKITEAGTSGIMAWWQDDTHWLKVVLDQHKKAWSYQYKDGAVSKTLFFAFPSGFAFNVYHTVSVYKNTNRFTIKIDDLPAPVQPVFTTNFYGSGIPGLCTNTKAAFDGVLYTIGWDEFDSTVTGWKPLPHRQSGSWKVSGEGISQTDALGTHAVFKGDLLPTYEISLQVEAKESTGSAGIYPVYINENNFIQALFDFKKQRLVISGKDKGESIPIREISLQNESPCYADMRYTDFIEKHFTFNTPAVINAIRLNKIPHGNKDTIIENICDKMDIFYKTGDEWRPLTTFKKVVSAHPSFDQITFDPITAEGLKFVNKQGDDLNFYVYKIWVDEMVKQSYNLRVAKLQNELVFIVDGKEVLRITHHFPPSQAGLLTENTRACFNGITLFHLPGE